MFKKLNKPLNYKEMRALHIAIVFAFSVGFEEFFHFAKAGLIGFTVILIYAGFDSGATLLRAYQRFWGALAGVLLSYVACSMTNFDYRIVMILTPTIVFFAYFFQGKAYSLPTMFTVSGAVVAAAFYFQYTQVSITPFLFDYAMCTILAIVIVFCFEFFWFRHYRLMGRFIVGKEREVLAHLLELFHMLHEKKIKRPVLFKLAMNITRTLSELDDLLKNSEFEETSREIVGDSFRDFVRLTTATFVKIKAIYFAQFIQHRDSESYVIVYQDVKDNLERLENLLLSVEGNGIGNKAHA